MIASSPTASTMARREIAAPPGAHLFSIQIVLFQEFGPESLWRSGNIWPTLRRKVHEIPIQPHRIDMIRRQFSPSEVKNPSTSPHEYMHHWPLHVFRFTLAF